MSNALPDFTAINKIAATVSNPQVTSVFLARTIWVMVGLGMMVLGMVLIAAASKPGQEVIKAGTSAAKNAAVAAAVA